MSDSNKEHFISKEEFKEALKSEYEESLELQRIDEENKRMYSEIRHKELKIRKTKIDQATELQETIEEEDLLDRGFDINESYKDLEDRKNALTFIDEKMSRNFICAPGSLMVVCSQTNNGKSTLTAKIAETLINEDKRILILSNEEKETDIRARISCLRQTVSFGDYKTNKCTDEEIEKVTSDIMYLSNNKKLIVISPKNLKDAYRVTTVKGVMSTLNSAKGKFDAVIIDYYTNINRNQEVKQDSWTVNNELATELNIFKDSAPFPIILFAQCKGIKSDKKTENKGQVDYASSPPQYRWIGGQSILLYATDIIELVRDFENSCSWLYGYKIRFSHENFQPLQYLAFDKKMQRYIDPSAEWDAKVTAERAKRKTQDDIKKYGLDRIGKD